MARSASRVASITCLWACLGAWLWASDQAPNPAEATAAHMHSTPAIHMGLHNTRPAEDARAGLYGSCPRRINGLAGMGSSAAVATLAPASTGWAWAGT